MSAAAESKYSEEVLSELLAKVQVADNKDEAASNIASFLNSSIVEHDVPAEFFADLKKQINNKKAEISLAALTAYEHIASGNDLAPSVEPYVVELTKDVAAKAGDKNKDIQAAASCFLLPRLSPQLPSSLCCPNSWTT